jgi:hypothetical protein
MTREVIGAGAVRVGGGGGRGGRGGGGGGEQFFGRGVIVGGGEGLYYEIAHRNDEQRFSLITVPATKR